MESVHGLHLSRNVKPAMGEIVKRFDEKNMAPKCFHSTGPNGLGVREEHGGKDQLKSYLNPHVKDATNQIVIFLSRKLFLCHLVIVIVLIDQEVMQGDRQASTHNTQNANEIKWKHWSPFPEKSRNQEKKEIIVGIAGARRMAWD